MKILSRIKGRVKRNLVAFVRHSTWHNEAMFPDCSKFWGMAPFSPTCAFDLQVVNLGSTSGLCAFNYEGLPIKAKNWALRQNPLAADKAILENYSSFLDEKGATVIIPLCAFSSLSGSYLPLEDRYYTILSPRSIPAFSRKRMNRILSVKDNPLCHYPLMEAMRVIKRRLVCFRRKRGVDRTLSEQEMECDAQQWMDGWFHEFGLKDFSTPLSLVNKDGIADAVRILNAMILFCREHGFRPVLVVPPMFHTLTEKFTPQARELLFDSLIKPLEHHNVSLLNYMDDKDFVDDALLFQNSFLLNSRGAKKFTKRLLSDIGLVK